MNIFIPTSKEINVTHIEIILPILYGEEEMPKDFHLRKNDEWTAKINIDTKKIEGWPADAGERDVYLTVKDAGTYRLLRIVFIDSQAPLYVTEVERNGCYVPNAIIPGRCGETVELKIAADGTITNWSRRFSASEVEEFFSV